MLALLVIGLQGARKARVQGRLDEIMAVRDEVQLRLDEKESAAAAASALKGRIGQFDAIYDPRRLSQRESLDLRLGKATVANAEQRFTDALILLTDEDEKANRGVFRVLQVRGDAFYGLREWQNALERYQQILVLQTNRIATMARVADCEYALGKRPEALAMYAEVARKHRERAERLQSQGNPDAAKKHYQKADQIQKWIADQ